LGELWQWYFFKYAGKIQSPIPVDAKLAIANESFLFTSFRPVNGSINFYNTTIYLRPNSLVTQQFGEIYHLTSHGQAPAFRATEIRFRSRSEHSL